MQNTLHLKKRPSFSEFVASINSETTTKTVWNKIKSINGNKVSRNIPIGNCNDSDETKANMLLQQFSRFNNNVGTYVVDDIVVTQKISTYMEKQEDQIIEPINEYELRAAMKTLYNTSPEIDAVPNELRKKLPPELMQKLLSIYNTSLFSGMVPVQ